VVGLDKKEALLQHLRDMNDEAAAGLHTDQSGAPPAPQFVNAYAGVVLQLKDVGRAGCNQGLLVFSCIAHERLLHRAMAECRSFTSCVTRSARHLRAAIVRLILLHSLSVARRSTARCRTGWSSWSGPAAAQGPVARLARASSSSSSSQPTLRQQRHKGRRHLLQPLWIRREASLPPVAAS
jgi:hypothetical protein